MAFWNKLGRGLVKVGKYAVPIALGATGVGIPAAMAAGAGLSALDKKLEGGTWKGAMLEGALGAAGGYGGSQLGSSFAQALGRNLAKEGVKAGAKGLAGEAAKKAGGEVAKKAGMSAAGKLATGVGMGMAGMQIAGAIGDVKNRETSSGYGYGQEIAGRGGNPYRSSIAPSSIRSTSSQSSRAPSVAPSYSMSRQDPYRNAAQESTAQNLSAANPFARAMAQGRRNAILSQPWRAGDAPPPGTPQEIYDLGRPAGGYLPPIFPQGPFGWRPEPPPQPEPEPEPEPQYEQPQYYDEEEERRRRPQY